jgi:hypothetical protein
MLRRGKINKVFKFLGAAIIAVGFIAPPAQAQTSSTNVAYIQTQTVSNGGSFPFSSNLAFSAFNFFQLPYTQVNAANLGAGGVCGASACDTVLLNVVSGSVTGVGSFYCNVNGLLSAQAKTDLISFVNNGGKLIIYDSECSTQNYGWLPYPFTTSNPGAQGATGTVSIVEDNDLSSNVPADTHYINAGILGSTTDAVGDMNVMTTRDPAWCLDMSGTNVNQVTGPTHTYARYGNGLIIYNGFDVDVMNTGTAPNPAVGSGNLAKIWLHELQVPFNPSPLASLPCGVSVVGITLAPPSATNDLSLGQNSHTVTATLKNLTGVPQAGVLVSFSVLSGPNAGASGACSADITCHSDANGQVSFTYSSNGGTGNDTINACYNDNQGQQVCSQNVTKDWVSGGTKCDLNSDGKIDRTDIQAILRLLHTTVPPSSPLADLDNNGIININDARGCTLKCTNARCAP